ncbi:LysM domain-containing protein [Actinoalloteichus sp. GBA129-24]|nr:LysM domain-containing protein [Actinoalloteichus sp. GBA129-24]
MTITSDERTRRDHGDQCAPAPPRAPVRRVGRAGAARASARHGRLLRLGSSCSAGGSGMHRARSAPAARLGASTRPVRPIGLLGLAGLVLVLVALLLGMAWGAARPSSAGPVPEATTITTVGAGETVWSIARRAVPGSAPAEVVDRIRLLNGPEVAELRVGRVLRVPAAGDHARG